MSQFAIRNPQSAIGDNQAYYWGMGGGLHIGLNQTIAIYHEYGHYLQDEYASWINLPGYYDDVPGPGHYACVAQGCVIWPYFEGFGHLVGALSYIDIYGLLTAGNPYTTESRQWWIEDPSQNCGSDTDYWNDPLRTEAAVAAILNAGIICDFVFSQ
ncbi:MAG: hypothetical protein QME81_14680 [bacterium]|nr:hypothetical protein [bacterium]